MSAQPEEPTQELQRLVCNWDWNDWEQYWQSGCGEVCVHFDCDPSEWGFKFCPYCGKSIVEEPGGGDTHGDGR